MSKLSNQAAVAGTPGVLVIGERTLLVQKPSANDLLLMQRWVLSQPTVGETQGLCDADLNGLSPERQLLLIREFAKAKNGKRTPTDAEIMQLTYSPAGVALQLWLAARKNHPDFTREKAAALVTADNADQVAIGLDAACDAEDGTSDPKKPAGQDS